MSNDPEPPAPPAAAEQPPRVQPVPDQQVPPWPEALGSYIEAGKKRIPVEVYPRTLGRGILPDRPHTECRQLDLRFNYGDMKGFRYIAMGIPLRARTDDPYLCIIPHDDGEIILAICEVRARFRDWPLFHRIVIQEDGVLVGERRTDHGRRPTKTQNKKIDQALKLVNATLEGRFTARGRPHEDRDAARARLLEAAQHLKRRYMKIGRKELMKPLMVRSVDGVADVLDRAGWTLDDLEKI